MLHIRLFTLVLVCVSTKTKTTTLQFLPAGDDFLLRFLAAPEAAAAGVGAVVGVAVRVGLAVFGAVAAVAGCVVAFCVPAAPDFASAASANGEFERPAARTKLFSYLS